MVPVVRRKWHCKNWQCRTPSAWATVAGRISTWYDAELDSRRLLCRTNWIDSRSQNWFGSSPKITPECRRALVKSASTRVSNLKMIIYFLVSASWDTHAASGSTWGTFYPRLSQPIADTVKVHPGASTSLGARSIQPSHNFDKHELGIFCITTSNFNRCNFAREIFKPSAIWAY
jgi:hypothetical protein